MSVLKQTTLHQQALVVVLISHFDFSDVLPGKFSTCVAFLITVPIIMLRLTQQAMCEGRHCLSVGSYCLLSQ